jgi:hypothetical protein
MMGVKQRMRTMKTTTELTGFVATNVGGITKLSTHPGNEGEGENV